MLWWTIQNLAVAAVLAGLAWAICRSGRIGPVGRHALWLVVLLKLLTPPLLAWPWAVGDPAWPFAAEPAGRSEAAVRNRANTPAADARPAAVAVGADRSADGAPDFGGDTQEYFFIEPEPRD